MENIRRISMGTKRPDTIPESTPRLKIRGDRYAFVSVGAEKEFNKLSPSCLCLCVKTGLRAKPFYDNEHSAGSLYKFFYM